MLHHFIADRLKVRQLEISRFVRLHSHARKDIQRHPAGIHRPHHEVGFNAGILNVAVFKHNLFLVKNAFCIMKNIIVKSDGSCFVFHPAVPGGKNENSAAGKEGVLRINTQQQYQRQQRENDGLDGGGNERGFVGGNGFAGAGKIRISTGAPE